MITPTRIQTTQAVAAHYDELDPFYREIWGEHVHHGYWVTGMESSAEAVDQLVDLVASRLELEESLRVCDIGCGYGATARRLAQGFACHVTGLTVSEAQARFASAQATTRGQVVGLRQDWLSNTFADASFERSYAIESSEHMPDKQRFFDEAWRTLTPRGRLVICAWLARDNASRWEVDYLLEPICSEGRLPNLGEETTYMSMAVKAGFRLVSSEDISLRVRKTWSICGARIARRLVTDRRYVGFLLDRSRANRIFILAMIRMILAFRLGSMRYLIMAFIKD